MKAILRVIACLTIVAAVAACDRAPDGIIKESKMAPLMADIYEAEAYIDMYPNQFMTDSSRMAMKQSVMAKHGVTIKDYEKSLDWYAHHLDIYTKVCENASQITEKRYNDLADLEEAQPGSSGGGRGSRKMYGDKGDTVNVWALQRSWTLTGGLGYGTIPFEYRPGAARKKGDRYCLSFKVFTGGNKVTMLIAADYTDGSTSFISRASCVEGWGDYTLQTDSLRVVNRIYGYIGYDIKPSSIAYVDSVQLTKTRLNAANYSIFNLQRMLLPSRNATTPTPRTAPAGPRRANTGVPPREHVPITRR